MRADPLITLPAEVQAHFVPRFECVHCGHVCHTLAGCWAHLFRVHRIDPNQEPSPVGSQPGST